MPSANTTNGSNWLLDALPVNERERVLAECEPVSLEFGDTLASAVELISEVYFPLAGYISQVIQLEGRRPLEVSLIGHEGMLGSSLVLDIPNAPLQSIVQGNGSCLATSRAQFMRLLGQCPSLLAIVRRYHFFSGVQLAKTAACTHFHDIEQRLARWLLMIHDRAQVDHFHLTHGFLAAMLGVRRSGVTVAAGSFQAQALISYTRGEIRILDRKRLEDHACVCYRDLLADYARYVSV